MPSYLRRTAPARRAAPVRRGVPARHGAALAAGLLLAGLAAGCVHDTTSRPNTNPAPATTAAPPATAHPTVGTSVDPPTAANTSSSPATVATGETRAPVASPLATPAPPSSAHNDSHTDTSPPHPATNDTAAGDTAAADTTTGGTVALATPDIAIPPNETVVAIPTPTATPGPSGSPTLAGCSMFPANNPWNQDISTLPVDANSANYISRINQSGNGYLHADFGGNGAYGIPYIVVSQSQPLTAINYTDYGDESDPGPFPIPLNAPVEGGAASDGDRHVLAIQQGTCRLFELFSAYPQANRWDASSGATFDLSSNALRPRTWTSADAAGLPILPGLVRYDEVQAGEIRHAVRFTVGTVRKAWVDPATHYGTSTDPLRIPYGAKLRMKANYDISGYHGQARVILNALKKYGMIVADQGTSWYITGSADTRWDDDDLNQLKSVPGTAFEVVQLGPIHTYP